MTYLLGYKVIVMPAAYAAKHLANTLTLPGKYSSQDLTILPYAKSMCSKAALNNGMSIKAILSLFWFVCSGIAHFSLAYGLRNAGMNYDRAMFGMKLPDCRSLAKTLEKCETLVTLSLAGNLLEDDKVRMIASGLVDNHSVTDLDLSHNKVLLLCVHKPRL